MVCVQEVQFQFWVTFPQIVEEEKNNIFVRIVVNSINLVKSWEISKLKQSML
jgi:hypothetical protein